MLYFILLN